MSFTDSLKAALGGAVSDAVEGVSNLVANAVTPQNIGTVLDPIAKTGLDWVMNTVAEPDPVTAGAGVTPGVYSTKTPPPGSGANAVAKSPQVIPPVVILAGVALAGFAVWHFTKGSAK